MKVLGVAMLIAVVALPLACGQLGSPESVDAGVIEPLPPSLVTDGSSEEALLRLGPVSRWRTHDGHILEGPSTTEVEQAIGTWDGRAAVVGLEPVGVTCEI